MGSLDIILLISGLVLVLGTLILAINYLISTTSKSSTKKTYKVDNKKDASLVLKNSQKKLVQNPKDIKSLQNVANIHYENGEYDKAVRPFGILASSAETNKSIDKFEIYLKYGVSLLYTEHLDQAYDYLSEALAIDRTNFDVNYELGYLEYLRGTFDKAITRLAVAREINSNHRLTKKYLGLSFFKLHKYTEAIPLLKKSLEYNPDDNEIMYALGQSYFSIGQKDKSLKIFTHLRANPKVGAKACLYAGNISISNQQIEKAIEHFKTGLSFQNISIDVMLELKYKLATAYVLSQKLLEATKLYDEIIKVSPDYKDVSQQIKKYSDLVTNKNLSTFLLSGNSEVATLCRKIATAFFPKARVKILDIGVTKQEYIDIIANISTPRWEDHVIYRFIRTTNKVSDLAVKELYDKAKEEKAGRGFCITAGHFTQEAKTFVEARLIDLIEKDALEKILKKISN